jgi:hypothetical protein
MVGADDADLHIRLSEVGKVVRTNAKVVHLHYLRGDYALSDYITNRKLLAKSYGREIKIHGAKLGFGAIVFAIIPTLAVIGIIPILFPYNILLLFLFAFWYMQKMYVSAFSVKDIRIVLLPFITIFLVYYETFWMIESFLQLDKDK